MLRIFRRLLGPARNPQSEPSGRVRASVPAALPIVSEPIPVPEVVEGNGGESDWNLWQDSMLTHESEFQQLDVPARGHEKTQPLSSEELKAYTSASKGGA
jgi:hypothetical protein